MKEMNENIEAFDLFERMFGQNIYLISMAAFPVDFIAAMQGNFFCRFRKLENSSEITT